MNILLDTHLAIWFLYDDPRLSDKARSILLNPDNNIYYSVVTSWEILLKHSHDPKNMLIGVQEFIHVCRQSGFLSLNLCNKHISAVESLTPAEGATEHKDPFDKLLLAQAKTENFLFLTHDRKFTYYNEPFVISV